MDRFFGLSLDAFVFHRHKGEVSEKTLSELVTHSPANLGRVKPTAKGKAGPSRLRPTSRRAEAVREETPSLSETDADSVDFPGSQEEGSDESGSPSAEVTAHTLSRAANAPFPGQLPKLTHASNAETSKCQSDYFWGPNAGRAHLALKLL